VNELTAFGASCGAAPRSFAVWGFPWATAGYVTGALKRPVMMSPWLWIAWTLRLPTSSLNRV